MYINCKIVKLCCLKLILYIAILFKDIFHKWIKFLKNWFYKTIVNHIYLTSLHTFANVSIWQVFDQYRIIQIVLLKHILKELVSGKTPYLNSKQEMLVKHFCPLPWKLLRRKWSGTAFLSPRGITLVENCTIVPKFELDLDIISIW